MVVAKKEDEAYMYEGVMSLRSNGGVSARAVAVPWSSKSALSDHSYCTPSRSY